MLSQRPRSNIQKMLLPFLVTISCVAPVEQRINRGVPEQAPFTVVRFFDRHCGWSERQLTEERGWGRRESIWSRVRTTEHHGEQQIKLPNGCMYKPNSWPQVLVFEPDGQFAGCIPGYRHPELLAFELELIVRGPHDVRTLASVAESDPADGFARWLLERHLSFLVHGDGMLARNKKSNKQAANETFNLLTQLYRDYAKKPPCLEFADDAFPTDVRFMVHWNHANFLQYHAGNFAAARDAYSKALPLARAEFVSFLEARLVESK